MGAGLCFAPFATQHISLTSWEQFSQLINFYNHLIWKKFFWYIIKVLVVHRIIKDLKNQGKGILIVTHDINFSFLISGFIIYQKDGIIKETFKPEEVQSIEDSDLEEFLLTGDKDEEC